MDNAGAGAIGFVIGAGIFLLICTVAVWGFANGPTVFTGTVAGFQSVGNGSNGVNGVNYDIELSGNAGIIVCSTSGVSAPLVAQLESIHVGQNVTIVQDSQGHCVVLSK